MFVYKLCACGEESEKREGERGEKKKKIVLRES